MRTVLRILVVWAIALALPLQGAAFAMARVGSAHGHAPILAHGHAHAHGSEGAGHDHAVPADPCDDDASAGILKCCHTPAAWLDNTTCALTVAPSSLERHGFVARWTSFIPEEPSPPPIAGLFVA